MDFFAPDTLTPLPDIEFSSATVEPSVEPWHNGLDGAARQGSAIGNSGILTMIVVLFVVMALNFKECRKLFKRFYDELINSRRRPNAFDEHSNHETRLTVLTVINFIFYSGLILCGFHAQINDSTELMADDLSLQLLCIAISAGYYLFEVCAYGLLGYTFAGSDGGRRWLRALNASLSLAGLGIMIPALVMLFYPGSTAVALIIAATVYLTARVMFIIKGFSIFYNNIFSLVYFILYLCTLEIIPVIFVLRLALLI